MARAGGLERLERRIRDAGKRGPTRAEFFSEMGAMRFVDELADKAFEHYEDRVWRDGSEDSPHGDPWHTSFHASSFPGDDTRACGRYAIYELMDIPGKEPASRRLRGQGEMGKAIELMLVQRFGDYGVLLSADQTAGDEFQTGFVDHDFWLTGNCDLLLLPPGWDRPHVVEVKSKAHDVVIQMRERGSRGRPKRGPDPKHVRQVRTYIGLANEQAHRWPKFRPCQDGTILYLSRDDPSVTWEFFYSHDRRFMFAGRERLESWRDSYLAEELPPHPFGGKEWSIEPCKYCKFKKHACKPDHQAGVVDLRKSNGIAWAERVRGEYDYDEKRAAVTGRWEGE